MNRTTIVAGLSALAIGGVLAGAALTSTAQAATPSTPTTPLTASHVTPAPNYSKSFHLTNGILVDYLNLIGIPPSRITRYRAPDEVDDYVARWKTEPRVLITVTPEHIATRVPR